MTLYTLAYLRRKQGMDYEETLRLADAAEIRDTYPARLAEIRVLTFAREQNAVKAPFLLGCLLYDKRQYEAAAKLFVESTEAEPGNYMTYRSLAIACFTHLNRKDEAVKLMEKARSLNCSQQVLYESAILMDLMGAPAAEKSRCWNLTPATSAGTTCLWSWRRLTTRISSRKRHCSFC